MGLPGPFGSAQIDLPESAGMTYGCHNSVRTVGYWVKDQVAVIPGEAFVMGTYIMRFQKDTSSRECRYDRKTEDERCQGCRK